MSLQHHPGVGEDDLTYSTAGLAAVVTAMVHFEVAAERAVGKGVSGPGSFVPAFLDELYSIRMLTADGHVDWAGEARVLFGED